MPQVRSAARGSAIVADALGLGFMSAIPGTAIPGDHPFQEGDDILGEDAEERLALLGGGAARVADVAGRAPLLA